MTDEEIELISRECSKEICDCFNISVPRGLSYFNGILGTIRIIIAEQIRHKGTARTGKEL